MDYYTGMAGRQGHHQLYSLLPILLLLARVCSLSIFQNCQNANVSCAAAAGVTMQLGSAASDDVNYSSLADAPNGPCTHRKRRRVFEPSNREGCQA
jgi:hypothetical protein